MTDRIITLNGTEYKIKEFKFGVMKKLWPYIQPKDSLDPQLISKVLDESEKIITICLQANYSDIPDDFIEKYADFVEVNEATEIIRDMIHEAISKKKTVTQEPQMTLNLEGQNGTGEESTQG